MIIDILYAQIYVFLVKNAAFSLDLINLNNPKNFKKRFF